MMENNTWICIKCSKYARSKCVWDRSIFHSERLDIVSAIYTVATTYENNTRTFSIKIPSGYENEEDFLLGLLKLVESNKEFLKQEIICKHEYKIYDNHKKEVSLDTECSLGHKH